jgi:hypothetical protein
MAAIGDSHDLRERLWTGVSNRIEADGTLEGVPGGSRFQLKAGPGHPVSRPGTVALSAAPHGP